MTPFLFINLNWLRGEDSNLRPLGYEPNELPTAPPRDVLTSIIIYHNNRNCQEFLLIIILYVKKIIILLKI